MTEILVLGGGWIGAAVGAAAAQLGHSSSVDPPLDPILAFARHPRDRRAAPPRRRRRHPCRGQRVRTRLRLGSRVDRREPRLRRLAVRRHRRHRGPARAHRLGFGVRRPRHRPAHRRVRSDTGQWRLRDVEARRHPCRARRPRWRRRRDRRAALQRRGPPPPGGLARQRVDRAARRARPRRWRGRGVVAADPARLRAPGRCCAGDRRARVVASAATPGQSVQRCRARLRRARRGTRSGPTPAGLGALVGTSGHRVGHRGPDAAEVADRLGARDEREPVRPLALGGNPGSSR